MNQELPSLRFPDHREIQRCGDWMGVTEWDHLTVANLVAAYRTGIFPWPGSAEDPLPWACPRKRAILECAALHIPRSLAQTLRRKHWKSTFDLAFDRVIRGCAAQPRHGQSGTWIHPEMVTAYTRLHGLGMAHSIEIWEGDELVGGLYGVDAGGVFCGESMFHRQPDASKAAIIHLVEHLRNRGSTWMDIQQMTPHMERLGAREIPRKEFLERLAATQATGLKLFGE